MTLFMTINLEEIIYALFTTCCIFKRYSGSLRYFAEIDKQQKNIVKIFIPFTNTYLNCNEIHLQMSK